MDIYRNTVRGNWNDTLSSDYSLTRQQFSKSEWDRLSAAFFMEFPPRAWELNRCVADFPKFLKRAKRKPWIAELADYEWTDIAAFIDASTVAKNLGRTNPSLKIRVYQHQIFNWVKNKARASHPPVRKPEVLLFYRDTQHEGFIRRADPMMLLILDHFSKPNAKLETLKTAQKKLLPYYKIPPNFVFLKLKKWGLIL